MNVSELLAEHNDELVQAIMELLTANEQDESVFRRLFSQMGVISSEFLVVTRAGQRSLNGYFALKGVKKQHNRSLTKVA